MSHTQKEERKEKKEKRKKKRWVSAYKWTKYQWTKGNGKKRKLVIRFRKVIRGKKEEKGQKILRSSMMTSLRKIEEKNMAEWYNKFYNDVIRKKCRRKKMKEKW